MASAGKTEKATKSPATEAIEQQAAIVSRDSSALNFQGQAASCPNYTSGSVSGGGEASLSAARDGLVLSKPPKQTIGSPVTNKADKKTLAAATNAPVETETTATSLNPSALDQAVDKPVKSAKLASKSSVAKPMMTKTSASPTGAPKSDKAAGKTAGNTHRHGFKPLEFIVYPAHGVGQIIAIEEQEVAGFKLELFVISFVKDKMILKVPTPKAVSVRMRKLAEPDVVDKALETLSGRARIKRTMWSRRAQEYEAKINSGDLIAVSEVVRDLYRSDAQPEQSYSERQLYEAALDRVARELAAVQKLTETESLKLIEAQLLKGPRRGGGKVEEIDLDDADEDGDIEEAA